MEEDGRFAESWPNTGEKNNRILRKRMTEYCGLGWQNTYGKILSRRMAKYCGEGWQNIVQKDGRILCRRMAENCAEGSHNTVQKD